MNRKPLLILFAFLSVLFVAGMISTAVSGETPPNLLHFDTAWFRCEEHPCYMDDDLAGFGEWVDTTGTARLSKKSACTTSGLGCNPSPDEEKGTSVQWDAATGLGVGQVGEIVTFVNGTGGTELSYQMWQVGRNVGELSATVYGCQDEADCEEIWVPFQTTTSSMAWVQEPLVTMSIVSAYPLYKIALRGSYDGGSAGFKYTGIYFADGGSPPPTDTPNPTETPSATVAPIETAVPSSTPDPTETPFPGTATPCVPRIFCEGTPPWQG